MKTLVHLSDLHFGRVDLELLTPLLERVREIEPDLVVVSGDLTQRARTAQFEAARDFLEQMPAPRLVVPGNHDVPLYNLYDRFLRPLTKYREIVEPDLSPTYVDDAIAVLGVNTARSLVIKDGRINHAQIEQLRETLCRLPASVFKVVVTHHPFDVREDGDEGDLVGRAKIAMQMFADCGVDLLLAGHVHKSHSTDSGERYALAGYEALIVSAGTATSTRGRGESNSFNRLQVEKSRVEVCRCEWNADSSRFEDTERRTFVRSDGSWRAEGSAA